MLLMQKVVAFIEHGVIFLKLHSGKGKK